jgi:hypothetical protein
MCKCGRCKVNARLVAHLLEELLERHLALRDGDDVAHGVLVAQQVRVPHLAQAQLRHGPLHLERAAQLPPVPLLQRVRLQLHYQHVHLQADDALLSYALFQFASFKDISNKHLVLYF